MVIHLNVTFSAAFLSLYGTFHSTVHFPNMLHQKAMIVSSNSFHYFVTSLLEVTFKT